MTRSAGSDARWARIGEVLRYTKRVDRLSPIVDGYRNFHHLAACPARVEASLQLEAGINAPGLVTGPDGPRRPGVAIRSSPSKAGHQTNPWHDEFDVDQGHIRYFGDHKPGVDGMPGVTRGNQMLLEAWRMHASIERTDRLKAPPLLIFRGVPIERDGRRVAKGHVEFCGAAVIERLEFVVHRDPRSGTTFPNLRLDLVILSLDDSGDRVDWRWMDDRRDPTLGTEECLRHAPSSWRHWVDEGPAALVRFRRRALSSRIRTRDEQRPAPETPGGRVLDRVYRFFDNRKHAFEHLAALVAADVLSTGGATYREGWLTRAGGDGGLDFVGRLDVGTPPAYAPLVVLGQAKCVQPGTQISAEQIARVVARLQRGWLGVFVTTGVFSQRAQAEVLDDRYPLVLIPADVLVVVVQRLASTSHAGDVDALLKQVVSGYALAVTHRRPEEILSG